MGGGIIVNFSIILMIIGIICIILSFFIKDSTKKLEKDLEDLSLTVFQETNGLKRRVKLIEEEMLIDTNFNLGSKSIKKQNSHSPLNLSKKESKPINEILVQQVISLDKQGLSIADIQKLSTLSEEQILSILSSNGGNR